MRGKSFKGDIALDDISVQDGQCPPQALCTFDDPSMCGWRNIHGDNFDWTRSNGGTVSSGTGPRNDHTYGTTQGIGFSYNLVLIMIYSCSKVGRVFQSPNNFGNISSKIWSASMSFLQF